MNNHNSKNGIVEIVVPGNTPTQVENATVAPYCYVGLLQMTFPNDKTYFGTGTLIADEGAKSGKSRHVLTCAHNLYDKADGGRAKKVEFIPMFNCGQVSDIIEASDFFYPDGYNDVGISRKDKISELSAEEIADDAALDYAIVKLSKYVMALDAPTTYVLTDDQLKQKFVHLNGYGYFGKCMSHAKGDISEVTATALKYPISTKQGASGTAIVKPVNQEIVGIHTRGIAAEDLNQGVRITSEVQANLQTWLTQ